MNAFYLSMRDLTSLAAWTFGSAAFLLFYAYLGYPMVLGIVSLFRRPRPRPEAEDYRPAVSVLIAAYNEEETVARKLEETLAAKYPADRIEIVVASDGSTDRTDEIVSAFPDSRVRLVRVEGRKGKTNAQNEAIKICRGEIIVFSDATAVYHPESISRMVAHYANPNVGAVSGRYKYFDAVGKSPTGLGSVAFWNYENLIKLLQSKIGTLTGCSGCIYSVRKSRYTPLPVEACSDLVEPLHIVKRGFRVAFEPAALAYEETTESTKQEFRMRVRVGTRGMRGVLSVPELLHPWRYPWVAFQLLSHKVMRWLVPVFLLLLFISSGMMIAQPVFQLVFGLQIAFYALAAASTVVPIHKYSKLLGLPLFFCTLNAAAAVSLLEVLRGHKYTTWETVRRNAPARDAVLPTASISLGATTGKQS